MDYLSENNNIHRYDDIEQKLYSATIHGIPDPAYIIPISKRLNQFVVSSMMHRSVYVIEWNGIDSIATIVRKVFRVETSPEYFKSFMNIGKASPDKHLYTGTNVGDICADAGPVNASLYRYTKETGVTQLKRNVIASSGMAWNRNTNKFYYIDSCKYNIREYDWSPNTDLIRKLFRIITENVDTNVQ